MPSSTTALAAPAQLPGPSPGAGTTTVASSKDGRVATVTILKVYSTSRQLRRNDTEPEGLDDLVARPVARTLPQVRGDQLHLVHRPGAGSEGVQDPEPAGRLHGPAHPPQGQVGAEGRTVGSGAGPGRRGTAPRGEAVQ